MTEKEIEGINTIREHIEKVGFLLTHVSNLLMLRAVTHDRTKFFEEDLNEHLKAFEEKRGRNLKYGSAEYAEHMEKYSDLAEGHYALNRHHPESHANRINDMNLIDLLEMLCDWCAQPTDIHKSIEINAEKYDISPQLRRILENTVLSLRDAEPCEL